MKENKNKIVVGTYLERGVYERLQKIAEFLGVSVSEYLRRLVLNDLEKCSAFTKMFNEVMVSG